jgi:hypothetical protein
MGCIALAVEVIDRFAGSDRRGYFGRAKAYR